MPSKPKHSVEHIAQALIQAHGLYSAAAQLIGCDRSTIDRHVARSALLREVVRQQRETFVDHAEMRLFQAVDKKEPWAVAMVVKTLGKNRGYVERTEQAISGSMGSNVRILLPAKGGASKGRIAPAGPIAEELDEGKGH